MKILKAYPHFTNAELGDMTIGVKGTKQAAI